MVLLRPLAILLALVVSDLHCLPWFVNVSESQGPGTILWSFSFNCSSYTPTLKLLQVQPPSTFFNPPSLARWQGLYVGQLTLSSSARLDALAVNHYELQLQVTCGSDVTEGPLSVGVRRDPDHAQCTGRFARPQHSLPDLPLAAGEVIQVPETVTPGARLYTLLPGLELQGAQVSITSAQDPPHFPGPFSINGQGWLQAPPQGLRGQAPKLFQLQVLVTFGRGGRSCRGLLTVRVLPLSQPAASLRPSGQVNASLDCDSPGACPQLTASLLVLDGGQPPMSTEVPVLVMVTPVNEFSPTCVPRTFRVREDAGPRTLLGSVVGTDTDYPRGGIEYHTPGGPATFAVDRLSGEVRLLGPLDYEQQRLHRLAVLVTDHSQGPGPAQPRSGSCTVAIEVEDVNDHAPECEPPFQELTIHPSPGSGMEVTKLSCRVPQEPQRQAFSYSLVGGNSQGRFRLQGAALLHDDLLLGAPPPKQPQTYELLIRVADAGPSTPHLSTTATVIVHLVPWRASTVATRPSRATVPPAMTPLLVTRTEPFWQPEPWFVVLLTVTGALLLAVGWLLCRHLRGIQETVGSSEGFMEAPRMETPEAPGSIMRLQHFDGRAQDSRTGREFLFNSRSGAWRWL
ncbi:PREDICTED: cadherin-related family member 4 [Myotis brandtii]|uniref:cadherin-related family member 4 n=1 Tax=Myotis brandtii TaxID=109478 RepID=UPI0007046512|nr:PREDICTED: cadherin-related family member 4 [Myotis brandtii]